MVPDEKTCLEIMAREGMFENIVKHSLKVAEVSLFLAEALLAEGIVLNTRLLRAAALLHDITKTRSIDTGENHASTGARFLESLGYPELAPLVADHISPPEMVINETSVLNYSDKRVMHDVVASLRVRFDDLTIRYGYIPLWERAINQNLKRSLEYEKMLFEGLAIGPERLLHV